MSGNDEFTVSYSIKFDDENNNTWVSRSHKDTKLPYRLKSTDSISRESLNEHISKDIIKRKPTKYG